MNNNQVSSERTRIKYFPFDITPQAFDELAQLQKTFNEPVLFEGLPYKLDKIASHLREVLPNQNTPQSSYSSWEKGLNNRVWIRTASYVRYGWVTDDRGHYFWINVPPEEEPLGAYQQFFQLASKLEWNDETPLRISLVINDKMLLAKTGKSQLEELSTKILRWDDLDFLTYRYLYYSTYQLPEEIFDPTLEILNAHGIDFAPKSKWIPGCLPKAYLYIEDGVISLQTTRAKYKQTRQWL